jgi:hypothetical protein
MKKVMSLTVAMATLFAGVATADLAVDWANSNMPVYDVGGTGSTGPFIEGGLIQLIWSSAGISTATAGGYAVNSGSLLAGEYLLDSSVTGGYGLWSGQGGIFDDATVAGADINSGYFFTRIFEDTGAEGEWFVDVNLVDASVYVYDASAPNTTYSANAVGGVSVMIDQAGTYVVPEPATIGLMGVAGIGMFLTRRKVRR